MPLPRCLFTETDRLHTSRRDNSEVHPQTLLHFLQFLHEFLVRKAI